MNLLVTLVTVTLAHAANLNRVYLPPNAQLSAGSIFLETPHETNGFHDQTNAFHNNGFHTQSGAYSGFKARPERAQAIFERNAAILRQDNANDGETYAYAYETENGIYGEENGVATNGVHAQGGYSYTGDDGKVYSVRYTADENGFQPQGDHLPTPPPIPKEILRALEQNARDEAAGIYDDGLYRESKYNSNNQQQHYINNNAQANNYNDFNSVVTNNALTRDEFIKGSNLVEILKAYLPPFSQGNNIAKSDSHINGVQKTYLPPFGHHNDYRNVIRRPTSNINALERSDAEEIDNTFAGIQNIYLPPIGNNQRSKVNQSFNDNVFAHNNAAGSSNFVTNVQKTYLPPFAQHNNQDAVEQSSFNNNAHAHNDAVEHGSSGIPNAYLPPFGTRVVRQTSSDLKNTSGNVPSSFPGTNNQYLPPTLGYLQSSLNKLDIHRVRY